MIEFFRSWCEGIIIAVVISIIIEALLPENNIRKYVKVVIGIYITYTILNPFLGKINTDIDFGNIRMSSVDVSANTIDSDSIQNMYLNGISENLKNDIEEKFDLKVNFLNVEYDENYENITKISMEVKSNSISSIEKVQIGNTISETEDNGEFEEVKKYISENYQIDIQNITIT